MTTEGSGGGDEAGVALISRERELLRGEADSGGLPSMSAFEEARAGRQLTHACTTLKVCGFRSFGWAPRSLKGLVEIF